MNMIEALASTGFLRRPPPSAAGHREWLHFCVHAGGVTLIVNFSIVDDLRPAAAPGRERARLLVLVRDRDRDAWDGDADDLDVARLDAPGGQLRVRFERGSIELEGGRHVRLAGALRRRSIAFELQLAPASFPSLACDVALGDEAPINWLVVPRLHATGWLRIGDREHRVDAAPAYHDHNWGGFSHKNFAWSWGHASSDDGRRDVVLARLLDRTQTTAYMQSLLLWCDGRQDRVFRADDISVRPEGWLRPPRPLAIPRATSLLAEGAATEVPRRLHVRARGDGDEVSGWFDAESVARVAVPHDHDLGTTFIHEVVGRIALTGRVRGEPIAIGGPGVFELLGSAR